MAETASHPADLFSLSGQTVVVTGALGVLGSEIAAALAARGANLVLLDRNVERGDAWLQGVGPEAAARRLERLAQEAAATSSFRPRVL